MDDIETLLVSLLGTFIIFCVIIYKYLKSAPDLSLFIKSDCCTNK